MNVSFTERLKNTAEDSILPCTTHLCSTFWALYFRSPDCPITFFFIVYFIGVFFFIFLFQQLSFFLLDRSFCLCIDQMLMPRQASLLLGKGKRRRVRGWGMSMLVSWVFGNCTYVLSPQRLDAFCQAVLVGMETQELKVSELDV